MDQNHSPHQAAGRDVSRNGISHDTILNGVILLDEICDQVQMQADKLYEPAGCMTIPLPSPAPLSPLSPPAPLPPLPKNWKRYPREPKQQGFNLSAWAYGSIYKRLHLVHTYHTSREEMMARKWIEEAKRKIIEERKKKESWIRYYKIQ
ncbi:hypothetical protein CHS0354_011260 [Potamilus streckersoni]|uniref:Uncharacterized protein n=1 Tax=Potamilus streckersoni TaxID=2493646 RepID=A0AAE0VFR2_9BIVA|nr:hypothetical protein CHS0354_011260 [Potamilus streckersoni]